MEEIQDYEVVIAGGGIAGLTAAAYLARENIKVLLIEKNPKCGGLATSIEHNGFVLDAGVKGLINAGIIKPMLRDLGISLELTRSKVSVGIENKVLNINDEKALEGYRELLLNFFPESKNEVNTVIAETGRMMRYTKTLYAVDNPEFRNLKKDYNYLLKELLPWMPSFLSALVKINRLMMPVESYLSRKVQNRALSDMVLQHFFRNMPTFFALGYFYVYFDYLYPKGGIGQLAKALEEKFIETGGTVFYNTAIQRVDPSGKFVVDNHGRRIRFRQLVWAADLKTFYRITDNAGLAGKIRSRFERQKNMVENAATGDSVFEVFLEVDEPPETFAAISNPHFFYTPSPRGLGTLHREDVEHLIKNRSSVTKKMIIEWAQKMVARNTFEISIPVLRDPALAPPGKTGIIVNFFTDFRIFEIIQKEGWLEEFRKIVEKQVIDVLAGSIYPQLKTKLIHAFSFTPVSIRNYVSSSGGAITGWAFGQKLPVVHKMHKVNQSVRTPIPDILQAGQWSYSPTGVPMSVLTGKIAAGHVLKRRQQKKIS